MIEFGTKFCKDWSSRKKTYLEKQIGLLCANKPSEVYPNTLPPVFAESNLILNRFNELNQKLNHFKFNFEN